MEKPNTVHWKNGIT